MRRAAGSTFQARASSGRRSPTSPTRACSPTISSGRRRRRPPRTTALNIVNGDVFRWRRLWPRLADVLGVEPVPFDGEPAPLEQQMADAGEVWPEIVRRHGLRELPRREAGLVVAHRCRPGAHDRDVHRHGQEQATRLRRRARHRDVVHRPLRAPAGRADRAVSRRTLRRGRLAVVRAGASLPRRA